MSKPEKAKVIKNGNVNLERIVIGKNQDVLAELKTLQKRTEKDAKENSASILASLIKRRRAMQEGIEIEINQLVKKAIPDYNRMWMTIGTWDCKKSPIGLCVYNHMEDEVLDDCLYCHEPDERK